MDWEYHCGRHWKPLSIDAMTIEVVDIARVLGGSKALDRDISLFAELKAAIERGFPAAVAKETMDAIFKTGTEAQRVEFINLVFDTLDRRDEIGRKPQWQGFLTPAESERTERVARIFALAIKALGDEETARSFMLAPHKYLGSEIPLRYLSNEVGALEVEQILNSILYGLPA